MNNILTLKQKIKDWNGKFYFEESQYKNVDNFSDDGKTLFVSFSNGRAWCINKKSYGVVGISFKSISQIA